MLAVSPVPFSLALGVGRHRSTVRATMRARAQYPVTSRAPRAEDGDVRQHLSIARVSSPSASRQKSKRRHDVRRRLAMSPEIKRTAIVFDGEKQTARLRRRAWVGTRRLRRDGSPGCNRVSASSPSVPGEISASSLAVGINSVPSVGRRTPRETRSWQSQCAG